MTVPVNRDFCSVLCGRDMMGYLECPWVWDDPSLMTSNLCQSDGSMEEKDPTPLPSIFVYLVWTLPEGGILSQTRRVQ